MFEMNREPILTDASALQETHPSSSSDQDDQDLGVKQHDSFAVDNEEVSFKGHCLSNIDGEMISTGANGALDTLPQDDQEGSDEDPPEDYCSSLPLKSSLELNDKEQPVSNTDASPRVVSTSELRLTPYQELRLKNLSENEKFLDSHLKQKHHGGVLASRPMNLLPISKTTMHNQLKGNHSNDSKSSDRKALSRNSSKVARQLIKETLPSSSDEDSGEDISDRGISPFPQTDDADSDSSCASLKKTEHGARRSLFVENNASTKHSTALNKTSSKDSAVLEKYCNKSRPLHLKNITGSKNKQPGDAQKPLCPSMSKLKRKSPTQLFEDEVELITPPNVNATKRRAVSLGSMSVDNVELSSSPDKLITQRKLGAQKPLCSSKSKSLKRKSQTQLIEKDVELISSANVNAEKRRAKSSPNNLITQQTLGPQTCSQSNSTPSNKNVSPTPMSVDENDEDSGPSSAHSDNGAISGCDNDLSEPLSAGELNDHLQTTKQKPPTQVQLKKDRKKLRNSGQSYVRKDGVTVAERKPTQVHVCSKLKCQDIVTEEIAETLCQEFWNLGDIDKERQYIASRINRCRPLRRRQRVEDSERIRNFQYKYHLDINGERHQVCKSTFLGTLCLSEKMVRTVTDKVSTVVSSLPGKDSRGHCAPKHKLPAETEAAIKNHINSFPCYVSHYSREQTNALYFASNLNIRKMYNLYCQEDYPKVSFSAYYLRVKASGRKFKKASFATCSKCDKFKLQIDAATSEEEKHSLKIQLERHHRKAEQAYELKRQMKLEAEADPSLRVLVYDMEKVLPCPYLKCKEAFYLRQLNVFNVTVTDTTTKLTHCYMWHEVEGGRSANSIASSVLKHIMNEVPHSVKRIVIFSDACTSQNRNSHVSAMYHVALQEHPTLQTIEHIFLIPGHTHLEVDNKHSVMERFKSNRDKVSHPEEYYDLIHQAGLTDLTKFPDGKFFVVEMRNNFFDFANLLSGPLIKREVTQNGNKFNWLDTNWFRYTKQNLGLVEVKTSYSPLAHFDVLSFLRRGVKSTAVARLKPLLKKFYTSPQPISELKKKNLISMLPFIEEKYHEFYHSLPTSPGAKDVDPDLDD